LVRNPQGSHNYDIGDHGELIVIADYQNPTKEIYLSWNEGTTFEPSISVEKFLIKNNIIEPSSTSQHFIVYGKYQKKGTPQG